jgi:hypothetical protein
MSITSPAPMCRYHLFLQLRPTVGSPRHSTQLTLALHQVHCLGRSQNTPLSHSLCPKLWSRWLCSKLWPGLSFSAQVSVPWNSRRRALRTCSTSSLTAVRSSSAIATLSKGKGVISILFPFSNLATADLAVSAPILPQCTDGLPVILLAISCAE